MSVTVLKSYTGWIFLSRDIHEKLPCLWPYLIVLLVVLPHWSFLLLLEGALWRHIYGCTRWLELLLLYHDWGSYLQLLLLLYWQPRQNDG